MKTMSIKKIATLTISLLLSATAWAAPTSGPYVTDPQNEYVHDATSDSIGTVNMILCILGGMNINDSGMLNKGSYIALIDMNKCKSSSGSSSSSSGSSGASAAADYMTAIVNATRGAGSTDPMLANIWMSMTEQGNQMSISIRLSASKSPTEVPPYGEFRLDYIGKNNAGATKFNGYIDSTSGNLKFLESNSSPNDNVSMSLTPGATTASGSGTLSKGTSPSLTTYNFNYNTPNFRRSDATNDRCFSRLKTDADKSVWRLGTYKDSDGSRVDQANPSFPITASYSGSSYYGYAGYYGIGFQGLDLNSISGTNPISGLVVTDQRPGNTTTYNLSKVKGKLIKWTQVPTTLSAMSGIPFYFYGNLDTLTSDPTNVNGYANWQMQWNNSTAGFTVTGKQVCVSSCTLTTFTTPATVNAGAFINKPIRGWSESFGGEINIPSSTIDHVSGDAVNYFSQSTVIPGSAPANLYCLNRCPDTTSVTAANTNGTGSPYNVTTETQGFFAPTSGGVTVSYTFDAGGLKNAGTAMTITNASFYSSSPQYQWGVMSGRLFDTALSSCIVNTVNGVCEPITSTYYTWQTGTGQWNQSMWLTKTSDSSVVAFDPPQNIAYTVPSGTAYGTWAGKQIQLQFNGFGNLYGVPGYCVSPVDNKPVDCSTGNARYVPLFSIPDAATMTLNGTLLIVKALDAELRLKDVGAGAAAPCSALTLTPLPLPSGGTHDMTSPTDAYYIGVKPTVTGSPKVIDGIVQ